MSGRGRCRTILAAVALAAAPATPCAAGAPDAGTTAVERAAPERSGVDDLVRGERYDELRALGPPVLATLVELYPESDEAQRARIASAFYFLGWKSDAAKRLLLADVHTSNEPLRLQVQWALGRVSDSPEVVQALLDNMMRDPNPLFRDKAACALANDQIHLSDVQKVRLFAGLIRALEDPKPQVRAIALLALQIHTGQTRGFAPQAPPAERERAVASWRTWLDEYRAQL